MLPMTKKAALALAKHLHAKENGPHWDALMNYRMTPDAMSIIDLFAIVLHQASRLNVLRSSGKKAPPPHREVSQVLVNALRDPAYAPYCLRTGCGRMVKVAHLQWRCICGNTADAQPELEALLNAPPNGYSPKSVLTNAPVNPSSLVGCEQDTMDLGDLES